MVIGFLNFQTDHIESSNNIYTNLLVTNNQVIPETAGWVCDLYFAQMSTQSQAEPAHSMRGQKTKLQPANRRWIPLEGK